MCVGDLIEEETDFVKKIVMLLEDNRGRADPEAMSLAEQAQLMEECRDTLGQSHRHRCSQSCHTRLSTSRNRQKQTEREQKCANKI